MSEPVGLTQGQVHLWYARTEDENVQRWLTQCKDLLSLDERIRHQRFVFQKDRDQCLIARVLLRTTLSRYLGEDPGEWRFRTNKFGKPEIESSGSPSLLRFNLSHCAGLVVCAVTIGREIGVDCENINRNAEISNLASRVFSPREQEYLDSAPESQRALAFFRLWTLKEAYVKARGIGLSLSLQKFSMDLADPKSIGIHFSDEMQDRPCDWQFVQPTISGPYVVAVAVNMSKNEETLNVELHRA